MDELKSPADPPSPNNSDRITGTPLVSEEISQARNETPAATEITPDQAGTPNPQRMPQPAVDPAPLAITRNVVIPRIRLEKKHPLAIRWMHWINFPVLAIMIWSGMLIYWNDSDNAYMYPHAIYRVGIGHITLFRFFPDWFWDAVDAPYHVTQGLGYHFFFMWIFAINGFLYVLFTILSGEWRFVLPDRKSFKEAIQVTLVDLHLSRKLPPQKKYNGAQKIAYTSVVLMGAGSLLTGLAIYKPTQAHLLTTLLGGYEMARWEHFWLALGFCGFFLVHVTQVLLAGWNNFRSMVSGLEVKPMKEPSLEAERRNWK
jgi:thiosulfate reductase cytochrome b subunit